MVAGLVGAFMTSLYTFRMIFIVFHGEEKTKAHAGKGISHHLPLVVLMVLSTFIGAMIVPPLHGVLPATTELEHGQLMTLEITSGVVAIAGILLAAVLWLGKRQAVSSIAKSARVVSSRLWWFHAWGFDWLYDHVFVKPYLAIAKLLQRDPLNGLMTIRLRLPVGVTVGWRSVRMVNCAGTLLLWALVPCWCWPCCCWCNAASGNV